MAVERLTPDDAPALHAAILRSRELHHPWSAPPDTLDGVRAWLAVPESTSIRFGIRTGDGALVGVVNLNGTVRGVFHNAYLGYFALAPHHGQGHMKAGLQQVMAQAFGPLGLHRLEANVQPGNTRSAGLVRALGFRLEGHSPRYLFLDGAWRDHDRYAITAEEWSV